jgi:flagellar basal body-associated protein FliL
MARRTSQRTVAQSLILLIALLLLLAVAAVIAVRGISHGSGDNGDAAGRTIATVGIALS